MAERPPLRPRLAWQERPPSRPRVAWQEKAGGPQEARSPAQPNQVDAAQPPQMDADSLRANGFLRGYVDSIVSFLSSPDKEESHKIGFLMDIRDLCDTSRRHRSPRGLDVFCQRYELAEKIEVLLAEEPRAQLRSALRQIAMRAIAELSAVERVLEGKETRLLQACFSSVFLLPPEVEDVDRYLYLETVRSMDNMLEALLLNSGASRASELLHNIFQMLLTFGSSEREHVRQRALGRIEELSFVLAESPTLGVPKITSCIHKTLGFISTAPARQRVASLIVPMADKCPAEVVSTLLTIAPPGDSTALALWEVMFSVPQTLQNVLKELLIQLQDRHCRVLHTCWEDTSILRLAMLASSDLQDEEFAAMYLVMRFLREQSPKVLSLVLRALMTLSEREEMARKMKVMLPDLAWVLQYGNNVIKTKALVVFINVMAQLEREEASAIAVLLANLLLPFFDDELSQLRESSIGLFRHLMKMVVGNDKTKMKNTVRLGLLPLFFRMSDQVQSVAKVAREALLGAAELLKWKQLRHLVQTQQTWRTGESLLERDRSRAQELLSQSLPYLRDAQPSLREAALRFIGLAARHLRDPSEEELAEICRAIQPLEGDSDPSVCSLAAQTVGIVCSSWKRPRSRWSLRALCCWR
ncbi:uncharacterized protein [Patagioenas fasciata]|uniref:uncharacterized protein isoform X2 n=1 Tax=Patagioenas fasciata TaxID=372321 RepID=UPI003A992546